MRCSAKEYTERHLSRNYRNSVYVDVSVCFCRRRWNLMLVNLWQTIFVKYIRFCGHFKDPLGMEFLFRKIGAVKWFQWAVTTLPSVPCFLFILKFSDYHLSRMFFSSGQTSSIRVITKWICFWPDIQNCKSTWGADSGHIFEKTGLTWGGIRDLYTNIEQKRFCQNFKYQIFTVIIHD